MAREDAFDPYALLQALERQRVTYIVIGALGRVIHGSDEVTDGMDIVPSTREENLRRLGLALEELHARRPDGKAPALERDLVGRGPSSSPPAAGRSGSRSARACVPRSPPSTTTRACSPPSAASRTASRSRRCSA